MRDGTDKKVEIRSDPATSTLAKDMNQARQPGSLRGLITISPDFFDALPEEELVCWE